MARDGRDLDRLLGQIPTPKPGAAEVGIRPGIVTRSDAGGVFVTVLGTATTSPLGPCKAATYRREIATIGTNGTTFRYLPTPLPLGSAVLVANTDAGPWVVRHDLG